jgi:hypothetical protein
VTDARFPERWLTDRRILRLSSDAFRGFVNSLAYSVSNKTDGVIEPDDLPLIPSFAEHTDKVLCEAGLWQEGEDNWLIAEFADTQLSSSELEALAKARKANRARQAKWKAKQSDQAISNESVTNNVSGDVSETVTAQVRTGQDRSPVLIATNNVSGPPPSQELQLSPKSGTSPEPQKPKRKPARSQLPDDWVPPPEVRERMKAKYPHLDLKAECFAFVNHHQAHGNDMADWTKAFWTWLGNTRKFGSNGGEVNGRPVTGADKKGMDWMALGRQVKERKDRKELT